jgi:predicted RNase H-like nuclease (RuvC/YqgF family)
MLINKTFFLEIYLNPKKFLLSRKVLAITLVSLTAIAIVSLNQNSAATNKDATQEVVELKYSGSDPNVSAMQAQIDSLTSRVKHLSIDNKRLSSTGNKLSQQLDQSLAVIGEKLAKTKDLQLELTNLDQNIMRQYESLLDQQETFLELKRECKAKKDKKKGCVNFARARDGVDDLLLHIKSLKGRRDVLLSQIARSDGGL